MGNVWENELVTPTFVNDREIYIKAHITNTSDDVIEIAEKRVVIEMNLLNRQISMEMKKIYVNI